MNKTKHPEKPMPVYVKPAFEKEKVQREKQVDALAAPAVKSHERNKGEEHIGHLAAIVESSEDAIISTSLEGIIRSWNKSGEKLFGYTAHQAIGQHISLIIPHGHLHEEEEILEKIRHNESIVHFETVRMKKGGERVYVSLTLSPLKGPEGRPIAISTIARDITARKNSEATLIIANKELLFQNAEKEKRSAELTIANKELLLQNKEKERRADELVIANKELAFQTQEKADRASELIFREIEVRNLTEELENRVKEMESFSYSVSHDLRAPLRAVNGYAQMFRSKYETRFDQEADRLINKIVDNATKMGQLIDDLLTFSRLGRREITWMDIPVQEMVTGICQEFKNEQETRDIEFHIKPLLPAKADNTGIRQVWLNLISNAVKYSRLKEKAVIEIGSHVKGDEVIYYVKDNGAGFDMRYVSKLFNIFQRLHSEEEFEGTGIGLAIVQRIIQKHDGRVWAESKLNEETVFYFSLRKP